MALDGKVALITGSSRGIGRGIALKLVPDPPGSGAALLRADPAVGHTEAAAEVAAVLVGAAEPSAAVVPCAETDTRGAP